MRSHVGVYYWDGGQPGAGGQPAGEPWFVNEVDAHPGFGDAADKIAAVVVAIYAALAGDSGGGNGGDGGGGDGGNAADWAAPLVNVIRGADEAVNRNADHWFGNNGTVGNMATPVDAVDFWFRAWSEDDFDPRPTANVQPMGPNIQDLGDRTWNQGDDHWYEHGFRFPIRGPGAVPVGKYVLGGAAKDDGWFFDVAVASTVGINIIPDPKGLPSFAVVRDAIALAGGLTPKTAEPMPAARMAQRAASLEIARHVPPGQGG
jgi:hypothetical protein